MAGIRLELANPGTFVSARDYIEKHLAPVATELHRITNELLAPGSTSSEEHSMDMVPSDPRKAVFSSLNKRLEDLPKHVTFNGAEYFSLPKELLRSKQLKVQFTAVVYAQNVSSSPGVVTFRLVNDADEVIDNSTFQVTTEEPTTVSRILPFGDHSGSVSTERRTYFIEGRYEGVRTIPVCRRFSLSFVYL